ncbi:MAG: NifB/NifX family molybdenum-iron cluster-binding protein [Dehalococcoidia bacterium]|jgi:predicted Fe-Mo cluster-binding NifX family protein
MKIAIAANGAKMDSLIPDNFEESTFLLIAETDDGSFETFKNPEGQESIGMAMVREILKQDCEAVICGVIEKEAFEELAAAQITRYMGANRSAADALNLMDTYKLDIIRVPKGEVYDPDTHNHGPANCEGDKDYA